MVMSCIVLVWGICRLVRIVQSLAEKIVNKVMISMHIVAYLLIVVLNAVQTFVLALHDSEVSRDYEISTICDEVVYFVCSMIFGLLVNTIVTRIVSADNNLESESINSSLMTGSFEEESSDL